ncbi:MAG: DNA polymerase Y family protein [Proteobacteria bacterium]|nr:DNA polymerase Y family protein [Pseudomonadota bacterium]
MKRVASLYLPHWSIDRVVRAERRASPPPDAPPVTPALPPRPAERVTGWRPGARWAKGERAVAPIPVTHRAPPLVTVTRNGSRIEIAAASPAAVALGIAPGMALTQARASVPALDVRDADPDGDRADLERLAVALARRWTPIVAISDPDGLFLDLTGTAHLHGGEERMARRIARLLARLGFTARIAIADTTGAAWAMARFPSPSRGSRAVVRRTAGEDHTVLTIPPAAQRVALAPLPVAALRLDAEALELLDRLGIETIGELLVMPRAPLVRRFGGAIVRRLDQATGAAAEPIVAIAPPQPIAVERRFAEPILTAEAIDHWLGGLTGELAATLASAGLGARALLFVASRVDHQAQVLRIGFARATRDAAHIRRLIARRIEEIDPGYGIDALALHIRRAEPLGPQALGAALAERQAPDLAPLVDTLANRIGHARLWRQRPVESDVPERAAAAIPALDPPSEDAARLALDDVRRLDARAPDHPWHPRWPRPARLLRRPERLDHVLAELPDQPPRRFTWRGEQHQVVRGDGPERITGEWWRRGAARDAVRDYFRVEDEAGRRFWLFRRGDGVRPETGDLLWFIHGTFG